MPSKSAPEQDRAAVVDLALEPEIRFTTAWRVTKVEPLAGFRLSVEFVDGLAGLVDVSALIHSPRAGVFKVLADPERFAEVHVEFGAVSWPGEIDLAPDAMYAAIQQCGVWTL